jgi:hypothetical protein
LISLMISVLQRWLTTSLVIFLLIL